MQSVVRLLESCGSDVEMEAGLAGACPPARVLPVLDHSWAAEFHISAGSCHWKDDLTNAKTIYEEGERLLDSCSLVRAAAAVGTGVPLLQEVCLAKGVQIRCEVSNGDGSEEARGHGQQLQDLILERFKDQQGFIARVITGADCSKFIRFTSKLSVAGQSRLVCGLMARLCGNKAVIPLAATDVEYEGRGHMTYLFRKVVADFLSRHGVSVIAVEADHDFWRRDVFGLEELVDKRGNIDADLQCSPQDVQELLDMRTFANVPLLVGPLTLAAEEVPRPLTALAASVRSKPRRRSSGAGCKDWYHTPGKLELRPAHLPQGLQLVDEFFGGIMRPTLGMEEAASEAEAKAARDLLLLVAARACGAPAPGLLFPNSSLELPEQEGLEGITAVKSWEEFKQKLPQWRNSGALRRYLRRVAGIPEQEGEQEGKDAEQRQQGQAARPPAQAKRRRSPSPAQRQRRLQQRCAANAGAAPQASQEQQAQQAQQAQGSDRPAEPVGFVQPAQQPEAAAQQPLSVLLLDAAAQPAAVQAGLSEQLVGAYIGQCHLLSPEAEQKQETALRSMLQRAPPAFTAAAALMQANLPDRLVSSLAAPSSQEANSSAGQLTATQPPASSPFKMGHEASQAAVHSVQLASAAAAESAGCSLTEASAEAATLPAWPAAAERQLLSSAAVVGRLSLAEGTAGHAVLSGDEADAAVVLGTLGSRHLSAYRSAAPSSVEPSAVLRSGRSDWEAVRLRVVAFQHQHGRLPHQRRTDAAALQPDEHQLAAWCHRQRLIGRGCPSLQQLSLTKQQRAALEAIPGWWWEADTEAEWQRSCEAVAAFAAQHGHMPRKSAAGSKGEDEDRLGNWVSLQRQRRKRAEASGRFRALSSEQIAALQAIPGWKW